VSDPRELALPTDKMLAEVDDGVGWMIYNNPARHNAQSLEMVRVLAAAGASVEHREIASPYGHDSFLLPLPAYHEVVRDFLEA